MTAGRREPGSRLDTRSLQMDANCDQKAAGMFYGLDKGYDKEHDI